MHVERERLKLLRESRLSGQLGIFPMPSEFSLGCRQMTDTHESSLTPGKDFVGVGVGGVLVRHDKILLLLRKKPPERDHWTIPGGAIEFGEKVEDALLRELREEIGVQMRIVAPLGLTDQILPSEGTHWVSLRFLVDIVAGEPENACPESHSKIGWFPLESLPEQVTLTTREAVLAYRAWSKTGGSSRPNP